MVGWVRGESLEVYRNLEGAPPPRWSRELTRWLFYAETDDGGASVVLWPNGVGPAFVTPHEARCKPRAKSAMNAALDVLKMAHRH